MKSYNHAARALYLAARRGYKISSEALNDTTKFLAAPAKWDDNNRGNPAAGDNKLARIQFTASLAAAFEAGIARDGAAVVSAAQLLAPYQARDGSFPFDDPTSAVGSPVTYGTPLATSVVLRILKTAADAQFAEPIKKAEAWMDAAKPKSNLDMAAVLMSRPSAKVHLETLLKSQGSEGGWGPYSGAAAEAFDTAVVLLALSAVDPSAEVIRAVKAGRGYLIGTQLPAGGWIATTRPAGAQSYAQHISTTGWVTMALLKTNAKP